jgi:signal transduction histidine kinase
MSPNMARPILSLAATLLVGMLIYESLKQLLWPHITIWQSHTITILFTSTLGTASAFFVLRRYDRLNAQLHRESRERQRVEAALKVADRRKDEFLAVLAHELRNPLAPIRNAVEVMKLKGEDLGKMQWARDVIDRQSVLLNRLVDELLDVSRIARGKIQLQITRTDLSRIISAALEAVQPAIDARGHSLCVDIPATPLPLDVDESRMTQVVLNLLNNAIKYTPNGGRIRIAAVREGRKICLTVRDNGRGIAADEIAHVFDMFAQRSSESSEGGLGIGLSVVRRLVELHAGSVAVASPIEDGHGSEFVIRLVAADHELSILDAQPAETLL